MNKVLIRNAKEDDLPAILDIYNDVIINTTAVYSELPHTLPMRKHWYDERIANNFPVLVVTAGNDICGFCSYGYFRVAPCYRYTAELSVYVSKSHRGKGLSKIMLVALIEHARQNNVHTLVAAISADNEISIALHQAFGFEEVAHFKEVGYKFNRWLDLKFFELIVNK